MNKKRFSVHVGLPWTRRPESPRETRLPRADLEMYARFHPVTKSARTRTPFVDMDLQQSVHYVPRPAGIIPTLCNVNGDLQPVSFACFLTHLLNEDGEASTSDSVTQQMYCTYCEDWTEVMSRLRVHSRAGLSALVALGRIRYNLAGMLHR